jgi:tetratricopeptide (TPR) repeat protein
MNRIILAIRFLALSLVLGLFSNVCGAQQEGAAPVPTGRTEETNSQDLLRSYLQLQEQVHAIQLAVEHSQQRVEAATAQSARTVNDRLDSIENALGAQRARELDAVKSSNDAQQKSNSVMLIVAGSFATVGFAAMVFMAYFLWRTIQRLAEISAVLAPRQFSSRPAIAALGPGEGVQPVEISEQSDRRLLGAIDRLEKRIREMEHTARAPLIEESPVKPEPQSVPANGSNGRALNGEHQTAGSEDLSATLLVGKGKSLLNLEDAEGALECFEKALAIEPTNAEALVKKGSALEKLRRLDEALECYNRAILADGSMTIAYLYKGGLCNRMGRAQDALDCYEKALHAQET